MVFFLSFFLFLLSHDHLISLSSAVSTPLYVYQAALFGSFNYPVKDLPMPSWEEKRPVVSGGKRRGPRAAAGGSGKSAAAGGGEPVSDLSRAVHGG
jgi:hypothetical protein